MVCYLLYVVYNLSTGGGGAMVYNLSSGVKGTECGVLSSICGLYV